MKISIITVCYNAEATIEETINSVLSQTYQNIEYIIVDGLSTDSTIEIVNKYTERISQVISEKDNGIYDAMNKGIKASTGDVIGILNADDLYHDTHTIVTIMERFNSSLEINAVYGDLYYFKGNKNENPVRYWKARPYYDNFFDEGYIMPHPSLFIRKSVYDKVGVYYPNFKISSDYEFALRAFKKFKYWPQYLGCTIVKMRIGGISTSGLTNLIIGNIEIYKSWRMNNFFLPWFFFLKRIIIKLSQFNLKSFRTI